MRSVPSSSMAQAGQLEALECQSVPQRESRLRAHSRAYFLNLHLSVADPPVEIVTFQSVVSIPPSRVEQVIG